MPIKSHFSNDVMMGGLVRATCKSTPFKRRQRSISRVSLETCNIEPSTTLLTKRII